MLQNDDGDDVVVNDDVDHNGDVECTELTFAVNQNVNISYLSCFRLTFSDSCGKNKHI